MTTVALSLLERLLLCRIASARSLPISLRMSRRDLPGLCRDCGFTTGAEIGVWEGEFSAKFCEANPALHLICVDPWLTYSGWLDTKLAQPLEHATRDMDAAFVKARTRLAPYNCRILRTFSVKAAYDVPDGSLDFVYIDGNHTEAAVTEDLVAWAPKVRSGGWIGGHDYRDFPNKPTIHVIEAVQAYTKARRIDPWFILAGDKTPSFLWVVP